MKKTHFTFNLKFDITIKPAVLAALCSLPPNIRKELEWVNNKKKQKSTYLYLNGYISAVKALQASVRRQ